MGAALPLDHLAHAIAEKPWIGAAISTAVATIFWLFFVVVFRKSSMFGMQIPILMIVLASIFTILAAVFLSYWTSSIFIRKYKEAQLSDLA